MATKVLTIVGARPQFVKAAAVSREVLANPGLVEVMVHTGQHFDPEMSDIFFDELQIPPPAHHLDIHGGGHGAMTGRMLAAVEEIMLEERPDWVLVYGDTNSTLAGALAAAKLHVRVAHVEAGLRSFNRRMPEEVNRVLTDHVSALLLCPTQTAVRNLAGEGIERGVVHTGDVMFDATLHAVDQARRRSDILARLGLEPGRFALATLHRAENTDSPEQLGRVIAWLRERASEMPVVFPIHPRTRQATARAGIGLDGLVTCAPVGYLDMTRLTEASAAVYTDSGGLQKEAYFHRKPCVTLRDETEWVETIECGWNRLWSQPDYEPRRDIGDYGSGHAAKRIVDLIVAAG
ncbi:MAG TPA: UDP-N-acetylglucosamine 2-epimerase (non-hydrolyzing) [Kaistia sp.]|jgi:UDP-GlcNAc3NAcA epimerase|nr:UDP-N-acetylglucosamine 2-epimerase (non-hydrolyzing) [Kaistia sp.]